MDTSNDRPGAGPARSPDDIGDRYRLLVDLIPDGVVVHQDGHIVYVNQALARLMGAAGPEMLGRSIFDFVHPDSVPQVRQRLATLVRPGVPSEPAEVTLVRPDGSALVVESVSVLTSWGGRPALQAILRDLSEHKQAQATLRYQAALVQHVSDAIIATDAEGRVTSWNPAAEAIFGLVAEQALGRSITSVLGPQADPPALSRTGRTQLRASRPDGTELSIRAAATPLADGTGHVLLCSDETARRDAEHQFTAVVSALEEAVVVVDATGVIRAANPAAQQLFGEDLGQLVGRPGSALPLLNYRGEPLGDRNPLVDTHRTGRPRRSTSIGVGGADGVRIWLKAQTRPLGGDGLSGRDGPPLLPCAAVASFSDITERRAAAARLRHAATHDPLTGLPNRALLLERLAEARRRAAATGEFVSVLFVDLDNFKLINDSSGHDAGDEALRVVGRRLSGQVRSDDTVARIGGDEFVVLAVLQDPDHSLRLAERLMNGLIRPVTGSLRGHHLRASVGVVTAASDDPRQPGELLRDADATMYQAKTCGGHRVAVYDAELRDDLLRRLELGNDLREALTDPALWVAYQPLVDLTRGRWVGAEALSRWTHPRHGPIGPTEFIAIAEQSDLIHALGQRTLAIACRDTVTLRSAWHVDFSVSVNLSVRQLEDPALPDLIHDVLRTSALPARALCLEVTESIMATDETHAARLLRNLGALGVRMAIDDFGTGYSSLARLRTLPVDELKIDRSFITALPADRQARHLVRGIIELAHALDLQVVAEGVETADHARILAELGCERAQGYHFAHPGPLAQLLAAGPTAASPPPRSSPGAPLSTPAGPDDAATAAPWPGRVPPRPGRQSAPAG